jgi:hypothetical protein
MLQISEGSANPTGFLWELYLARWLSPSSFYQNQNTRIKIVRIEYNRFQKRMALDSQGQQMGQSCKIEALHALCQDALIKLKTRPEGIMKRW